MLLQFYDFQKLENIVISIKSFHQNVYVDYFFRASPLWILIGLHHPLDGITSPEYKLLRFMQLTIFLQREEGTRF